MRTRYTRDLVRRAGVAFSFASVTLGGLPGSTAAAQPAAVEAAEPQPGPPHSEPRWYERKFGLVFGNGLGTCARLDGTLGGAIACSDTWTGIDWLPVRRIHFTLEVGGGVMPSTSEGDSTYGYLSDTGGAYVFARPLFGFDFTTHFYARVGAEFQVFTNGQPGIHGVAEVGSILDSRYDIELGIRGFGGADGVRISLDSSDEND